MSHCVLKLSPPSLYLGNQRNPAAALPAFVEPGRGTWGSSLCDIMYKTGSVCVNSVSSVPSSSLCHFLHLSLLVFTFNLTILTLQNFHAHTWLTLHYLSASSLLGKPPALTLSSMLSLNTTALPDIFLLEVNFTPARCQRCGDKLDGQLPRLRIPGSYHSQHDQRWFTAAKCSKVISSSLLL